MFDDHPGRIPIWLVGLCVGLLLIGLSLRGRAEGNQVLSQYFAAQPTPHIAIDLPQFDLAGLPAELQQVARELQRRISGGQGGAPLTPSAASPRLRVTISELQPADSGLRIVGSVTNISANPLEVPISAFELRDGNGASYIAGGGGSARLAPGASTPLDLTVPSPPARGLLLRLVYPPDAPLEMLLLAKSS